MEKTWQQVKNHENLPKRKKGNFYPKVVLAKKIKRREIKTCNNQDILRKRVSTKKHQLQYDDSVGDDSVGDDRFGDNSVGDDNYACLLNRIEEFK